MLAMNTGPKATDAPPGWVGYQVRDQPFSLAADQRVLLHPVSWSDYQALLSMRGDAARPRIAYLHGELELMAPSSNHELLKKNLARLVEAYADALGLDLIGLGSWTLKNQAKERGLEPDECYVFGPLTTPASAAPALEAALADIAIPDIAIEVVWTHGGINKLSIYHGLGVPEVWILQEGRLDFHLLEADGYRQASRSRLWPAFDPALVLPLMRETSQMRAVRALREQLRARSAADGDPA
jgi:Uma2 family endonuclease